MAERTTPEGLRLTRERKGAFRPKRTEIASRVIDLATQDMNERADDTAARLQRYAKFRMWREDDDWPWEGSANIGLPDIMTDVLALQDTLHNAVMNNRPVATSRAVEKKDEPKQDLVDDLIDTQFFIEQPGEKVIEELADSFVMDGCFTAFVPWVEEDRKAVQIRTFERIDDRTIPRDHFLKILQAEFPKDRYRHFAQDEEGWDWRVEATSGRERDVPFTVKFYTRKDDQVEMVVNRKVRVYDGPRVMVKDYEDVLYPARSANLQQPGPANPDGAPHVILVDYPTVDEIRRHYDSGFYDLLTKKELESLENESKNDSRDEVKRQKDFFQGRSEQKRPEDETHDRLTRYTCFDLFDIDGDGENEDVIWWVLKEPQLLLKARLMTEMYPTDPPRRPLAEANMIPVKGRREGIGLIEMMEPLHDFKKQLLDQLMDAGTIANMPFGFYRATSNLKPETIRPWPGDLIPLSDPQNDVFFPQIGSQNAQSFGINFATLVDQMQEKLTVRGDLQIGRVPPGRSSALRTSQNLQSLLATGEARPQRILRRFFTGLVEIYRQIHELNQAFLGDEKKFRIVGFRDPADDPYREIGSIDDIRGRFEFDFQANVLNASRGALQESLEKMMQVYVSDVAVQLGITTPNTVYQMFRDWGRSLGFTAEKYLSQPAPGASLAPLLAEEAVSMILDGIEPIGRPLEGAEEHLSKLQRFMESDSFGLLNTPEKVALFRDYMVKTARIAAQDNSRAQLAAAAGPVGIGANGSGGEAAPRAAPANPQVNENELLDETLPAAGGGANGAA